MFGLKLTKQQTIFVVVVIFLDLIILILNYLFLRDIPGVYSSVLLICAILVALPFIIFKYTEYSKIKQIEDNFPLFLTDFVEAVRSGMPLPQALKHVSKNDYGELSKHIRKIAAQMDWGIPFDTALLSFSRRSGSKIVGRIVSTIIESHRVGGNLSDIFENISETTVEIERLREERKLYLQSQMMTGYIIFFVFLTVLIGLQRFLVPSLAGFSPTGEVELISGGIEGEKLVEEYKSVFRNLIILQGLFAGLVVGKMAEGTVVAGVKHSMILMIGGVIIFMIAT